jgi:hypothetical protein
MRELRFMKPYILLAVASGLALLGLCAILATTAFAAQCGDVDGREGVTASDAQRVLLAAVGLDVPMFCDGGECEELTCAESCVVLCEGYQQRIPCLQSCLEYNCAGDCCYDDCEYDDDDWDSDSDHDSDSDSDSYCD